MSTILKSIILSTLSATLLTGCLDDSNNDRTDTKVGKDGIPGIPGGNGNSGANLDNPIQRPGHPGEGGNDGDTGIDLENPLLRPGRPGEDGNGGNIGIDLENPLLRPGRPGEDGNDGNIGIDLENPLLRPGRPGEDGNDGNIGTDLENPILRPGHPGEDGNDGNIGIDLENPLLRPGHPGEDGNDGNIGIDLENPILRPGHPGEDGNDGNIGIDLENPLLRPGRPGEDGNGGNIGIDLENPLLRPGHPGEDGNDGNIGIDLENPLLRPGRPGEDGNDGNIGIDLENPLLRPGRPGEDGNDGNIGIDLENPILRPGRPGEDGNDGNIGIDLENPILRPGRPGEDGNDGNIGIDLENPLLRPGRPGEDGNDGNIGIDLDNPILRPGRPGEDGNDGNIGIDLENPLLRPGRPGEDGNDGNIGIDLENPLLRPGRPGEDGNDGKPGAYQELYGHNAYSHFMAQIVDNIGGSTELDSDGKASLNNIVVTPHVQIKPDSDPALFSNVAISEKSATFQLISYTGSGEDLTKLSSNATLQFDLKVNDKVGEEGEVELRLQDESDTIYSMSLTSAINAYGGAATQRVKVPFSCFEDMDLSQSIIPFALNSTTVDFDLGSVRVVSESLGQDNVLECDFDTFIIEDEKQDVFIRAGSTNSDRTGLFSNTNPVHTGNNTGVDFQDEDNNYAAAVPRDDYDGSMTDVGISFRANTNNNNEKIILDISNLIENYALQFDYKVVTEFPENRTLDIWLSTTQARAEYMLPEFSSKRISLNTENPETWRTESLPISDFFTDKNGQIDVNKIRHVRTVNIATNTNESEGTTQWSKFMINNLRFVPMEES